MRIASHRSRASSLLRFVNRSLHPFGVALSRDPAPTTLEWHIQTVLAYQQINCVLDVGANRGQFATLLRKLGYRGWIISFEPVPDAFAALSRRFADDDRWRGFEFALGEHEDTRPFHVAGGDAQASSFLEFNESGPARWGDDHAVRETISLRVRRLDDLWEECVTPIDAPRVFLKMDCQGFDVNVVRGAAAHLHQVLALQSELALEHFYEGMTHFTQAVAIYEELGFDVVGFFPLARRKPDFLRLVELDCLFMRAPDVNARGTARS